MAFGTARTCETPRFSHIELNWIYPSSVSLLNQLTTGLLMNMIIRPQYAPNDF